MEKEQREILRTMRVDLVEDIDVTGGLYTQLLSKNVINKRAVSNIKSKGTPEAQVEELLDTLAKRDCFETFCEALIADDQEHIVKKYLKSPAKPVATETTTTTSATQSLSTSSNTTQPSTTKATDSAGSSKRMCSSSPPMASIIIRESNNGQVNDICIRYAEGASPNKRPRPAELENTVARFEPGETRYVPKHYITEETDQFNDSGNCMAVQHAPRILDNPQSIGCNPNISDPLRYQAAFPSQNFDCRSEKLRYGQFQSPHMSSPLKDPSSRINEQDLGSGDRTANFRDLLRPNVTNTQSSLLNLNHYSLQHGRFDIRNSTQQQDSGDGTSVQQNMLHPDIASTHSSSLNVNHHSALSSRIDNRFPHATVSGHQYLPPQQYLRQVGVLPTSKEFNPNMAKCTTLPNQQMDSVDTMTFKGSTQSVNPGPSDLDIVIPTADSNDSCSVSFKATAPAQSIDIPSATQMLIPFPNGKPTQNISSDLDQIDLPDGCVTVNVEHTNRQFFLSSYKKAYPMRRIPRGLALIINVDEVEGKPPRKGTNFDRDNLCNLLSQLHFNIVVYNDQDGLSAQDMVYKLKAFAKMKEHHNMDACFICLLSHGEEGYIFGTDGKRIPLDEIFMLFGNTNCKALIGKPKIFIIQACRGGTLDKGVRMDEPDGGSVPMKGGSQLPSMSDMLICYPTLTGYYAWRNRARGSWYIEAIVQIFMRYAKNEDICAMLNRVNQLVSRKVSESNHKEMNQMSQMSEYKSTLRQPHLYLFPGIGCTDNQ